MLIKTNINKELSERIKKLRKQSDEILAIYDFKNESLELKFFNAFDWEPSCIIRTYIQTESLTPDKKIRILENSKNIVFDYILKDRYILEYYKRNVDGLKKDKGLSCYLSSLYFRNVPGTKIFRYDKICSNGFDDIIY